MGQNLIKDFKGCWQTLLFLFFVALVACGENADLGDNPVTIPNIDIQCRGFEAFDCGQASTNNKTVYVFLTTSIGANCRNDMDTLSVAQLKLNYEIHGQSTTNEIISGRKDATITNWFDQTANPVLAMASNTTYQACAFIDEDNDGFFDRNLEPAGSLQFNSNNAEPIIDDWT